MISRYRRLHVHNQSPLGLALVALTPRLGDVHLSRRPAQADLAAKSCSSEANGVSMDRIERRRCRRAARAQFAERAGDIVGEPAARLKYFEPAQKNADRHTSP